MEVVGLSLSIGIEGGIEQVDIESTSSRQGSSEGKFSVHFDGHLNAVS